MCDEWHDVERECEPNRLTTPTCALCNATVMRRIQIEFSHKSKFVVWISGCLRRFWVFSSRTLNEGGNDSRRIGCANVGIIVEFMPCSDWNISQKPQTESSKSRYHSSLLVFEQFIVLFVFVMIFVWINRLFLFSQTIWVRWFILDERRRSFPAFEVEFTVFRKRCLNSKLAHPWALIKRLSWNKAHSPITVIHSIENNLNRINFQSLHNLFFFCSFSLSFNRMIE